MTKDKAESAKAYIERKYSKLKCEEKERKEGKSINYFIIYVYSLGHVAKENAKIKFE